MTNYYKKYLKYKNKCLRFNSDYIQYGGNKPILTNYDKINLFTDDDMEQFLNPIYGLIMCDSGFISNNYWLHKAGFLSTELSEILVKILKYTQHSVQPNNNIMVLDPIDFGRYIAIKYINSKENIIVEGNRGFSVNVNLGRENSGKISAYISKMKIFNTLLNFHDEIYFYILLYCMWWVLGNYAGIVEYYKGINEVFYIFNVSNRKNKRDYQLVSFDKSFETSSFVDESFEVIIGKLTQKKFNIYDQKQSKNFCNQIKNISYPDCGETTARNLINLICFDGNEFNISVLENYGATDKLIEYYKVFNNFAKQVDTSELSDIFGAKLNPRDAWSYLVINYAGYNLSFVKKCEDSTGEHEIGDSIAKNGENTNFFQLIKNLLPEINSYNDLISGSTSGSTSGSIVKITDNTSGGIGDILIKHSVFGNFVIGCVRGHYYMKLDDNNNVVNLDYMVFGERKQKFINALTKQNITIDNYLWIDFDAELFSEVLDKLCEELNYVDFLYEDTSDYMSDDYNYVSDGYNTDKIEYHDLIIGLFKMTLTDKYDYDTRRRINLDTDSHIFYDLMEIAKDNIKINEYTYLSNDFNFLKNIPNLKHLNSNIENFYITEIDLSELKNIESIGNYFLNNCDNLTKVVFPDMLNLKFIENDFMTDCDNLETVIFGNCPNLESIGKNFFKNCPRLSNITFRNMENLVLVKQGFLEGCIGFTELDLSSFKKLTSIDQGFLKGVNNLDLIEVPLHDVVIINNINLPNVAIIQS